jgi:hypothetical protein
MKTWILAAAALVTAAALFMPLPANDAMASGPVCLKVRDLGTLTQIDDMTLLATSRGQGNFIVRLRSPCPAFRLMNNPYTLRVVDQNECFDGNDVLDFPEGGPCFIQSVTPAPAR